MKLTGTSRVGIFHLSSPPHCDCDETEAILIFPARRLHISPRQLSFHNFDFRGHTQDEVTSEKCRRE